MLKKTKLAILICGSLIGGVAAAQTAGGSDAKPDFKAKHAEMRQKILERFDTNRDGKLDESERKIMLDVKASELFKKLDTDGNGQLSLAEFKQGGARFMKHHRHARRGAGQGRRGGTPNVR